MRLFAEENQTGTIEFLTTKPLKDWEIIMGKYLAGVALVAAALLPTLIYYITIYQLGSPKGNLDSGAIAGSYIGLLLLGSVFVAIGLFASSLTNNQIVSFLVAAFLCFFVHWGFDFISRLPFLVGNGDDVVEAFGISAHYSSISRGVVVIGDVVYFLSVIGFFLLLCKVALERRKW
jgi:ABC-2 type transport system permease protein